MPTVFVSDLDGTLLQPNGLMSSKTEAMIREVLADGALFTVASARSLFSIRAILGDIPFELPVLSFNGGYISEYATGRHLKVCGITLEVVQQIRGCLGAHHLAPFVSTFSDDGDHLYVGQERSPAMEWFYEERRREKDTRLQELKDINDAFSETVTCISVMGEYGVLAALESELVDVVGSEVQIHLFENLYDRGSYWLTIHPRQATKAQGLKFMLEHTGLTESTVVVFGDHMNDLEMFNMADEALAVHNAEAALKKAATRVIGPNYEDSVAREIHRRVSGG